MGNDGAKARPDSLKLFISYSRKDAGIAEALVASLEARGFAVKIDTRDLPFGEAWQAELASFIQEADTVIWLVSRHSVSSHWCNWELAQVIRMQKRFVPVVIGEISVDEIPKAIGDIHLLPAGRVYDEKKDLDDLVTTLNTNRSWIKTHTRLTDRALEWSARGKAGEGLLRGRQLQDAIMWRDSEPPSAPHPGTDVLDLILQSQRASAQRQRFMVIGAGALAVVLMGLTIFSFIQQRVAVAAQKNAEQRSALLASGSAEGMLDAGQTDEALLVLMDAAKAFTPETAPDRLLMAFDRALNKAMVETTIRLPSEVKVFGTQNGIYIYRDEQVWRVQDEGLEPIFRMPVPVHLDQDAVSGVLVAISEDGRTYLHADGMVQEVGRFTLKVPEGWAREYVVLPGGLAAMTVRDASDMPQTQLMELSSGATDMLVGEYGAILDYALMPDGQRLIEGFDDWIEVGPDVSQTVIPYADLEGERERFRMHSALPQPDAVDIAFYERFMAHEYVATAFENECLRGPGKMVCSSYEGTSSGVYRIDYLLTEGDESVTDLDELFTQIDRSDLKSGPGQNRSWIGFSPDGSRLATVNNGELTVFGGEYGYYVPEHVRGWSHAHRITAAQFIGNTRIAVATAVDPMIRIYTLDDRPAYGERSPNEAELQKLSEICDRAGKCLTSLGDDLLEGASPVEKNGYTLSFDQLGNFIVSDANEVEVLSVKVDQEMMAGPDAVFSAFFHKARDGVVAHYMNEPVVWFYPLDGGPREELYRAGKSVVTFDMNAAGDLYAVIEYRVGGEIDAILYSSEARREWRHLASEYKWLNAVFLEGQTVAIANGNAWSILYDIPTLSDVTTDAKALLSPDCQPEEAGDYATSPCWPL
ncbi:toll/interleukin-1 receptor domain-containing protein [Parvularcula flava]|uniref:Toll/interleukin-1 receptor domain-containing protein n=1 Tax=Aquisalinus luteolus TaxID=1566827 RepID=A0A8J3ESD4_9PROT|nr:toll/interleukin-1 receptor domain-containing protein [Aquisalinus luteolus]NHK28944.1 toll/interleukin-1 receptor domain-containing protein [Aquisalinus luteolus]GGI00782.1 hypothetical protein GCM10011355_29890 [Aquisalinus luteolus]